MMQKQKQKQKHRRKKESSKVGYIPCIIVCCDRDGMDNSTLFFCSGVLFLLVGVSGWCLRLWRNSVVLRLGLLVGFCRFVFWYYGH